MHEIWNQQSMKADICQLVEPARTSFTIFFNAQSFCNGAQTAEGTKIMKISKWIKVDALLMIDNKQHMP
jgi:hypothetical protein